MTLSMKPPHKSKTGQIKSANALLCCDYSKDVLSLAQKKKISSGTRWLSGTSSHDISSTVIAIHNL